MGVLISVCLLVDPSMIELAFLEQLRLVMLASLLIHINGIMLVNIKIIKIMMGEYQVTSRSKKQEDL